MPPILASFGATSILKILAAAAARPITYTFSSVPTTINENNAGTFNVTTTNFPSGGTLYWTINNITTTNADFNATSGSFTITNDAGSFTITPTADVTTEGSEIFTVSLRTGSISGTIVATSQSVTVGDTSIDPTYTFTTTPSSINEGSAGSFTVTTTNVPNANTVYWSINNITTSGSDFSATTGSFTITANSGSFTITPTADATSEGSETFNVSVRVGSTSGRQVAVSSTVTVNDTSINPGTTTIEYLIIGGGGGGGASAWNPDPNARAAGGGGGGGYRTGSNFAVNPGPYTITVGGGGPRSTNGDNGTNGSNSGFSNASTGIWSAGGGGGGGHTTGAPFGTQGSNGGSGGGGRNEKPGGLGNIPNVSPSQGNNGGTGLNSPIFAGGGGGGAGAAGQSPPGPNGGNGGAGLTTPFSGTPATYSAGGGGSTSAAAPAVGGTGGSAPVGGAGTRFPAGTAGSGAANRGGGGGGSQIVPVGTAGSGGSGIVIIRYPNRFRAAPATTGSPTSANGGVGGVRTYTWTGSGSISF